MAGIFDNTRIAPNGTIQLYPVSAFLDAAGTVKTVTVPAGAISIQAIIDNEYSATYRLSVKKTGAASFDIMPAGTDFELVPVSPVFTADTNGSNVRQGAGIYPGYQFQYPSGCRGVVTAVFLDATKTVTVD